MSLLDWFNDKIKHPSQKYIYKALDPTHVNVSYEATPLEAGKHYFRLWLTEMYLKDDVEWFQSWYPAVHSLVSFQFGSQKVDVPYIAGSLNIQDFKANNLQKVLRLNYPTTTLMPFNGGVVEVAAGLLAMKGDNYVNNFIKVMGDFASLLVVPQLSTALQIAGPIANGIQTLLGGASDGRLELGIHQTFQGAAGGGSIDLKAGYIATIVADESQITLDKLWVVNDQLRYGDSLANNQPLTGYTYMLFRIESQTERDDWLSLSSIADPFGKAIQALGDAEMEKADSFLRTALVTALQSPDLTRADRSRVMKAMKDAFDQAKKDIGLLGAVPVDQATLDKVMLRAMDVDSALRDPEPTLEELFS